jgi:pimeloyl-[acyl-carrier protein] synthase
VAHEQANQIGGESGRDAQETSSVTTGLAPVQDGVLDGWLSRAGDPYGLYARLRAEDPVHRTPHGLWVLTRYADVAAVHRDPRFGREGFERHFGTGAESTAPGAPDDLADAARLETGASRQSMLFRDPPHHTRLRDTVSRAFSPRAVAHLRPVIQAYVDRLLLRRPPTGTMDVVAELAEPVPRLVISHLIGMPPGDWPAVGALAATVARSLDALPIPEDRPFVAAGQRARRALGHYFRELLLTRREAPKDDLVRLLIDAVDDGELSDAEAVAMLVLVAVAGTETSVHLIGTTVWALLQHPDALKRVREGPWHLPAAIEEAARLESPVQRTWRIAREDVELDDRRIPKGALVVALLGAANRDPARFPDPDRLDPTRRPAGHLAFGAGAHTCLGATLARLEVEVAVGTLLRHWPQLHLATAVPTWHASATLRGLASLPVTW